MSIVFLRICMVLISWGSLLFLPKSIIKKFIPVTFFSASILLVETLLSLIFKWWKVKGGLNSLVADALGFIFGPFVVINIWIFHLTHKRFLVYTLVNLIMDLIFAYPLNAFFQKVGFYKLKKFTSIHLFLTSYGLSFLNYWFQKFIVSDKNIGNAR
ncbi:hypothetical protein KGR20_18505 [Cytobacillus oceanisediminis]|uniref:Uncharacterized protein n=1 Tax=Niallia alba TaxID=2729105 RepID=A0A7Y0PLY1_9BACI|nr:MULTISPECIES: hypothetical protein [Bacillaceae]MBQ6448220.1 hypothetical protein [Bacillus sp. (in: firmicutes)]MBZ9536170.1 hypothetical protein [Cytobacillus oceanisediminis]NMO77507.1 hypothetical protein [Niallia alba]